MKSKYISTLDKVSYCNKFQTPTSFLSTFFKHVCNFTSTNPKASCKWTPRINCSNLFKFVLIFDLKTILWSLLGTIWKHDSVWGWLLTLFIIKAVKKYYWSSVIVLNLLDYYQCWCSKHWLSCINQCFVNTWKCTDKLWGNLMRPCVARWCPDDLSPWASHRLESLHCASYRTWQCSQWAATVWSWSPQLLRLVHTLLQSLLPTVWNYRTTC